jgi:hypothetical protein
MVVFVAARRSETRPSVVVLLFLSKTASDLLALSGQLCLEAKELRIVGSTEPFAFSRSHEASVQVGEMVAS